MEIAGGLPETLAKLQNQRSIISLWPEQGRGAEDAQEDEALERELCQMKKELAEHNMLVDLGRNDLGRVCRLGTVKVDKYCSIERFSTLCTSAPLYREQSETTGTPWMRLIPSSRPERSPERPNCGPVEIIGELEGRKRGIYGGAIGYLDFTGNMDTCIAIRLAYKKNGRVCIQSEPVSWPTAFRNVNLKNAATRQRQSSMP